MASLMGYLQRANSLDIILGLSAVSLAISALRKLFRRRTTKLRGPPAESWIFGNSRKLFEADDVATLQAEWVEKYGLVYQVPLAMRHNRIVLSDPKAATYFYSKETTTFVQNKFAKAFIELLLGKGLLIADGDSHKRQRKALTPAFSNQAIRALTTVFYDSFYKLKFAWDTSIDAAGGEAEIDVQAWMNKVSLDTIGIAGFSHDFGTLHGHYSTVAETFDSFAKQSQGPPSWRSLIFMGFAPILPFLLKIVGTKRIENIAKLNEVMGKVSDDLLAKMRKEKAGTTVEAKGPKSLIETLILAEESNGQLSLSQDEVFAQMKTLILAGYETTSISLTWALISLATHKDIQDALRAEVSASAVDPTYDQLQVGYSFPLLDAVVKETLRLNPPLMNTIREAAHDDMIPLGTPIKTASGQTVDSIFVAKGSSILVPIRYMNRSKFLWGDDALEFKPSRWLSSESGIPDKAKEVHGWAHMLTFSDGPRTCLGRQFALTEFKVVLASLIRNYEFRFKDGADTKLEKTMGILPRPRVAGREGSCVPMLCRKIE